MTHEHLIIWFVLLIVWSVVGMIGVGLVWLWWEGRGMKRAMRVRAATSQFQEIIDQNGGMTFTSQFQPPFRSPELPLLTTEHAQWPKRVEGGWIMTPEHLSRYRSKP